MCVNNVECYFTIIKKTKMKRTSRRLSSAKTLFWLLHKRLSGCLQRH